MNQAESSSKPGRIITFYSYKGGVGRSFALANVAAILAKWGAKVLCVDWDLEAPGLHHFFPDVEGRETKHSLLHLLESTSAQPVQRAPKAGRKVASKTTKQALGWKSCLNTVRIGATGKTVDLIPAGRETEDYVRRVHDLDWQALYEHHALGDFLERLRQEWTRDYDFVLLDSRTGLTDIGGICTIHLPDIVVSVFTANHQSMDGTTDMSQRINEQRRDFFYSSGRAIMMPLLSRWEEKDAPDDAKQWLPKVLKTLRPSYNSWRHKDASVERLVELLKIPYKAKWNFGERLAVLEESATDPGSVSYHLHLITALLTRDFAATDALVTEPDSYVNVASEEAPKKRLTPRSLTANTHQPVEPQFAASAVVGKFELLLLKKLDLLNERHAPVSDLIAIITDINDLRRASGRPLLELPTSSSKAKNRVESTASGSQEASKVAVLPSWPKKKQPNPLRPPADRASSPKR